METFEKWKNSKVCQPVNENIKSRSTSTTLWVFHSNIFRTNDDFINIIALEFACASITSSRDPLSRALFAGDHKFRHEPKD